MLGLPDLWLGREKRSGRTKRHILTVRNTRGRIIFRRRKIKKQITEHLTLRFGKSHNEVYNTGYKRDIHCLPE